MITARTRYARRGNHELRQFFGRMAAADENLRVTERFTLTTPDLLLYQFTVEDPTVWTAPWTGEIPLSRRDGLLYEYACHEGNAVCRTPRVPPVGR